MYINGYVTNYRKLHGKTSTPKEAFTSCRELYGNKSFDQENIQKLLDLKIT